MNEFFAAEPSVCRTANDLQLLLRLFGPLTGRYLAAYPDNWLTLTHSAFNEMGEIEKERVKTLLRRAKDSSTILARKSLSWNEGQSWSENAFQHVSLQPPVFQGLFLPAPHPACPVPVFVIDDGILPPPTADERVYATPDEYARVCKTILLISPELHLIDPFLNPMHRDVRAVVEAIFRVIAQGKCSRITLWARHSAIISERDGKTAACDIERTLRASAVRTGLRTGTELLFFLLRDEESESKMHGRYLISIKGGIRLDQGFRKLPTGRKVDVAPLGQATYDDVERTFHGGEHDFEIKEKISIRL